VVNFVANIEYSAWLRAQSRVKQDKGAAVKRIVQQERHWEEVSVTVAVLEPIIKVLRLTDGKSDGISLSFASKSEAATSSYYGASITSIGGAYRTAE